MNRVFLAFIKSSFYSIDCSMLNILLSTKQFPKQFLFYFSCLSHIPAHNCVKQRFFSFGNVKLKVTVWSCGTKNVYSHNTNGLKKNIVPGSVIYYTFFRKRSLFCIWSSLHWFFYFLFTFSPHIHFFKHDCFQLVFLVQCAN